MTRAAGQFAPPVVAGIVFGLALWRGTPLRAVSHACAVILATVIVISPILVRNVVTFDTWSLTSQGGTHLLRWVLPSVLRHHYGTPVDASRATLYAQVEQKSVC